MTASVTTPSTPSDRTFPILIIEDNPEHQVVMSHGLGQRFPQARPVFVQTTSEAIEYMQASSKNKAQAVRLILLDIYLPQPEIGWHLLTVLRHTYPRLPVIAISAYQTTEDVQRAYDLGVHSFIAKPLTTEQWINYFELLRVYWLETVTLPSDNRY